MLTNGDRRQREYLRTDSQCRRDAVRGRCGRCCTRLSGSRSTDDNIYSVPGTSSYDPEPVQGCRRAASGVFNVSARALASHALSIFAITQMFTPAARPEQLCFCESSVQEVMDLTPVAHCAALEGKLPFINFFDGFRTSHEIQKIETWDYEDLKDLVNMDAIDAFRAHALNPNHPCQRGFRTEPDIFFQAREACNRTTMQCRRSSRTTWTK